MMSEDQFDRFIKMFESRDLLIRIDENTKNFRENFQKHLDENTADFHINRQSITKAHDRIDKIKEEFGVQIGTIKDEMRKVRYMIAGAALLVTVCVGVIQFGISIYGAYKSGREMNAHTVRNA